ncbi:MAG: hypothetical protein AAF599_00160 [Bacteroidota bacterium]
MKKRNIIILSVSVLVLSAVLWVAARFYALRDGIKLELEGAALDPKDVNFLNLSEIPAKFRFKIQNFTGEKLGVEALYMEVFSGGKKIAEVSMPKLKASIESKNDFSIELPAMLKTAGIKEAIVKKIEENDGSVTDIAQTAFDLVTGGKIGEKLQLKGFATIQPGRLTPKLRKSFDLEVEV